MSTFSRIAVIAALALAGAVPLEARAPASDAQGKIISMQGQVQRAQPRQDTWDAAKVFQPLFVSERVRTLVASRAAILFAGKRGLLDLTATNLMNERFNALIEGLSVDPLQPSRRVVASVRWRVW